MKIWFSPVAIEEINRWARHSLMDFLAIEFTEIGDDYLCARMPVDRRTMQPLGSLHGGATCLLAETLGSVAANFCVDPEKNVCVGLEINANHIKVVKSGHLIATARPLHLGKSTQIWDIQVRNEKSALVAISRLTIAVLQKR
jgi:1,4-dihydroxy-2-naphthoyl-CoA hydrolase